MDFSADTSIVALLAPDGLGSGGAEPSEPAAVITTCFDGGDQHLVHVAAPPRRRKARALPAAAEVDRLIPWPEVERIVGFSRMHIGRLERIGEFPARVQIGRNRVAWWLSEIMTWARNRPRGPLPIGPQQEASLR